MKIRPYFVGRGGAGMAMRKSLSVVSLMNPELQILPAVEVKREARLFEVVGKEVGEVPILFLANPHGLHARYILEADQAGFEFIVAEKPVCVSLEEVEDLRRVKAHVSVCHGYRQMWGPQQIEGLIQSGEMGELISIEGRYWQSSAAQAALSSHRHPNWKNDPTLSGRFDAYLDLGAHWADLMFYFAGETPTEAKAWVSHVNAEASHRDTHVHLMLNFKRVGHTVGSISKTVHGAGNDLSFTAIGAKQSASWSFADPDRIHLGLGNRSTSIARDKSQAVGSQQSPFHGLGWLEGYVEIIRQSLLKASGLPSEPVPSLQDGLKVVETLLKAMP